MERKTLRTHYGGAVSGEFFWPRPEVDRLVNHLKAGESVSLFGLRRIGKSSTMDEAKRVLEKENGDEITVISIDAQDFNALEKLLSGILKELPDDGNLNTSILKKISSNRLLPAALRTALEALLGRKGERTEVLADHAFEFWSAVCNDIAAAVEESGSHFILMIDEFPYLCKELLADKKNGRDAVDRLLATLRGWRKGRITMILSGSIGMRHFARENDLEFVHLNDLISLDISPLRTREDASDMLEAMIENDGLEWGPDFVSAILDEISAFYPSFIQFTFSQLSKRPDLRIEDIPEIFATDIRPNLDATFFDQFDNRLKRYSSEMKPLAKKLLRLLGNFGAEDVARSEISAAVEEQENAEDLVETLKIMKDDGFIAQRVDRDGREFYRFSSPLVSAWWKRRHG